MGNFISNILLNGKTSTMGAGALMAAIVSIYKSWPLIDVGQVGIIFAGLTGLVSKDYNVSGSGK